MNAYLDYNKDGSFTYEDIFDVIKDLIKAQRHNQLVDGKGKKLNVMSSVRVILGKEAYERYEPMIGLSVDWIYHNFVKHGRAFSCLPCCSSSK